MEFEGTVGHGECLEAFVEGDLLVDESVTTDGIHGAEFAREGVDDVVVVVPRTHLKRLFGVEVVVRVGCAVVGESEDTFVDHGQGIGHGFAVLLLDRHFHLLIGVGGLGYIENGLEVKFRVFDLHGHHAVHAQRHVVVGIMRLEEGDVHIDVRNHLLGGFDFHLALGAEFVEHHRLDHMVVGFNGDQGSGVFVGGEGHHDVVAHVIALLGAAHGKLHGAFRLAGAMDGGIVPVEAEDLGKGIAALGIVDDKEVHAPLFVGDVDVDLSLAVEAVKGTVLLGAFIGTIDIFLEGVGILARPPPVAVHLIELVVEGDAVLVGIACLFHHGDGELPVAVGEVVAAVFRLGLGEFNTDVTGAGREFGCRGGHAEVAALFEHFGDEGGVDHLVGEKFGERAESHVGIALSVERAAEERELVGIEVFGVVAEGIGLIFLERGGSLAHGDVDFSLQA